jgi:hypothetical protein
LMKLRDLKHLTELFLKRVKISAEEIAQLKAALPGVQVSNSAYAQFMPLGSHEGIFVPADEDGAQDAKKSQTGASDKPDTGSDMLREIRRACAPLLASMAKDHGYGLAPGQNVKRVAPPFPPIRMDYYRTRHPGQADAIPTGPTSIVFHWKDGRLENWGMTLGFSDGYSVSGLLDALVQLKSQMVEGPADLLEKTIPGDWVIRQGLTSDQYVKELETLLQKVLSLPIQMEFREQERPVYVVRGKYHHTPLPGQPAKEKLRPTDETIDAEIAIFGKQLVPNSGSGGGSGKYREFLDWLGCWISTPIISEAEAPPVGELSWHLHGRSPSTREMRDEDHDPALVLTNITAQTGLTFRRETRPVKILFVEPTK